MPSFPDVWEEIAREYLEEFDTFVAHNAPFDRSCLERTAELYEIELGELKWDCSLKRARQIYDSRAIRSHPSATSFRSLAAGTTVLAMTPRCVHAST